MIYTTTRADDFSKLFGELLQRGKMDIAGVSAIVSGILDEIKNEGNEALRRHSEV